MKKEFYTEYSEIEDVHWWFIGRRKIILNILDKYISSNNRSKVLDFGCGTGSMLRYLKRYGWVVGVDVETSALHFARQRGNANLVQMTADNLSFGNCSFDLICAFDVIEHLDDDLNALREFYRTCRDGGHLILTVPAYRFLWGRQDEISEHKRRYTRKELRQKINASGFTIRKLTYFNTLLFLPIAVIRMLGRMITDSTQQESVRSDFTMTSPGKINNLLSVVFGCEAFPLRIIDFPFGVSILCIAEKRDKELHNDF